MSGNNNDFNGTWIDNSCTGKIEASQSGEQWKVTTEINTGVESIISAYWTDPKTTLRSEDEFWHHPISEDNSK